MSEATSPSQVGLSSVLNGSNDPSSDDNKPQSAVAAIASRFNATAASEENDNKSLSDKVSLLANRFGPTVMDEQSKYPPSPSLRRPTTASTKPKSPVVRLPFNNHITAETEANKKKKRDESIIQQSAGNVTNVAKIFDNEHSNINPLNKPPADGDDDDENKNKTGFLNAHNIFKKKEENEKNPQESKVSSFAKMIDSNATSSRNAIDIPPDNHVAGVAKNFEVKKNKSNNKDNNSSPKQSPKPTSPSTESSSSNQVGNVVSRFEIAVKKEDSNDDQGDSTNDLVNRFANATKLFESGSANTSMDNNSINNNVGNTNDQKQQPEKLNQTTATSTNTTATTPTNNEKPVIKPSTESKDQIQQPQLSTSSPEKQPEEDSPKSRFADAARVFGGS